MSHHLPNRGAKRTLPPCKCHIDPIEGLRELFVDVAQGGDLAAGRDPATRPVFLQLHGVAHGVFVVPPDLSEDLRLGVFAQGCEYPVWVRFSSDVQPGTPDFLGTVGIGIKLFGVEGTKLLEPEQNAITHDFIFQNHDVFFVDTAKDMCEFTYQSLNGEFDAYVKSHPITSKVIDDMKKKVDTVLNTHYWSVLPFRFGAVRYVKYKLEPELVPTGAPPDYNDPFYLRADLHARLKTGDARFRFLVQFQTNDQEMPLDRATIRWSEEASPPIQVATLILPKQDLDTRNQSEYGENLAFNTWHALAEHEPIGSIAAARKAVYEASAEVRRNFNATPVAEPVKPRPGDWKPGVPYPPGKESTIVQAKIHPAIGVARVGNSQDEYFIGPEIIDPEPQKEGFYRDGRGALKRQAARFRIYGYDTAGNVVRELTADWADIHWSVHVANRKAAWYRWDMALDVREANGHKLPRRNADVFGEKRQGLAIDGGLKCIGGKNQQGAEYEFRGKFQETDVYLGELRTDDDGRLLFLGGHGKSESPSGSPIFTDPDTFINADGWYDDISDGPVTADVSIDGRQIPVEAAWVVTAPPDYGPNLVGVRSLYDLLYDLYIKSGWMQFPERVSFTEHVYPLLRRLSDLQWTNTGFAAQFGHGRPNDFANAEYVAKLARDPAADGVDLYKEQRLQILHSFRDPDGLDNNQLPWPWIYGDAMQVPPAATPRQNATVSGTQYRFLQMWADGKFDADWKSTQRQPTPLDRLKMADRPAMLDRAALEFCLADAFHPGCEVTWPIRHISLYQAPFRIRHRAANDPEPDYGPILTPEVAVSSSGPIHAQAPGGLTRWMGLPWQADTGFCRAGYPADDYHYDSFIPAFWPARVPNDVLTEANYLIAIDLTQPRARRLAAFSRRMKWAEYPLDDSAPTAQQMNRMVEIFGDMGVVEVRDGVPNDADFPQKMQVASFGPGILPPGPPSGPAVVGEPRAPRRRGPLLLPVRYPKTARD